MTPGFSTILFSDFHAGHDRTRRARKLRAVDAMMDHARTRRVGEIVLAGDIADERPDPASVREECGFLRDAIAGYESIFLHGNHDDPAFFRASDLESMLRCRIDASPWRISPVSGVAVTHGHHFRTPSIRRALRDATSREHLEILCEGCERHHEAMTKGFSVAGKIGNSLESAGIPATGLWEDLQRVSQRSRSRMATALRRTPRKFPDIRKIVERIADAVDLRSVRHAARLARTLGTWGVVSGHTHVPGIYKYHLTDEDTGERVPYLVGNSGGFVSRYAPTFVEISFPRMTLWQFDEGSGKAVVLQTMELTAQELAAQQRVTSSVQR